jgi:uncharacterized protein (TIGR02996 family)
MAADRAEVIAFLEAIKEDSDDDTLRLILADWLEEHDDLDRATLIRLQCEAARLIWYDPRRDQLEDEASALAHQHREDWTGPLRRFAHIVDCSRGLFDVSVAATKRRTAGRFIEQGTECWAWVETLRIKDLQAKEIGTGTWERLLRHITRLELGKSPITVATMEKLAQSKDLARLRKIGFGETSFGSGGVQALAASPYLERLQGLSLWAVGCRAAGARALAGSPLLGSLTVLNLFANHLGDGGAEVLASAANLARLQALHLGRNEIANTGAEALASSPHLSGLKKLELNHNEIGNAGAAAIASSPHLANLTELHLYGNRIGDAGGRAILESPYLSHIRYLALGSNSISDYVKELLQERFGEAVCVKPE